MQVRKEEIRSRIQDAALNEFALRGYKAVTMKKIAEKSGIAAGNIYTYFSSKDALLKCLLDDAVAALEEIIFDIVPSEEITSEKDLNQYSHNLAKKYTQFHKQIFILMNGCEGSNYANVKSRLAKLACQQVTLKFPEKFKNNQYVAEAIAIAIIEGSIHILIQCGDNFELLCTSLSDYIKFIVGSLFAENGE